MSQVAPGRPPLHDRDPRPADVHRVRPVPDAARRGACARLGARDAALAYGFTLDCHGDLLQRRSGSTRRGAGVCCGTTAIHGVVTGISRSYLPGPFIYLAATLIAFASPWASVILYLADRRRLHRRELGLRRPGRTTDSADGALPSRRRAAAPPRVDEGARAERGLALLRRPQADPRREPAHDLRGGALPEHRRVLGPRHGDLPDPRRHLHARLPLLLRALGQARVAARPARAAQARPDRGRRWASSTSSSRPSTATTCPTAGPATTRRRSGR